MADILHGTTQLANILPINWAPTVEGFFRASLTLSNYCYDASAWGTGGKTVSYPSPAEIVAVAKTNETHLTEHVGSADPDAKVDIAMSTQYAVPLFFDLMAMKQVSTNTDLMIDYASRGGYGLRKKFETSLSLIIQTATTHDVSLGTDNTVTWALLASGWGKLGNYNIAPKDTALGMSGEAWGASVSDWGSKYTSAAEIGRSDNFLQTGEWGRIGAVPVYVSDDWDGDGTTGDETASLWAKKAVSFAIQGGVDTLGPTPHILGAGYELGLYLNYGVALAIDTGVCNFNNP